MIESVYAEAQPNSDDRDERNLDGDGRQLAYETSEEQAIQPKTTQAYASSKTQIS